MLRVWTAVLLLVAASPSAALLCRIGDVLRDRVTFERQASKGECYFTEGFTAYGEKIFSYFDTLHPFHNTHIAQQFKEDVSGENKREKDEEMKVNAVTEFPAVHKVYADQKITIFSIRSNYSTIRLAEQIMKQMSKHVIDRFVGIDKAREYMRKVPSHNTRQPPPDSLVPFIQTRSFTPGKKFTTNGLDNTLREAIAIAIAVILLVFYFIMFRYTSQYLQHGLI